MARYNSNTKFIDGYRFASSREAQRYIYLKACLDEGLISDLVADKANLRFILAKGVRLPILAARPARPKLRPVYYETDFRYDIILNDEVFHIWEDVKGLAKGKPFVDAKAVVKLNLFRAFNANDCNTVLRICTDPYADPLNIGAYFY